MPPSYELCLGTLAYKLGRLKWFKEYRVFILTMENEHKNIKAIMVADLHLHHLPLWRFEWLQEFVAKLHQEMPEGSDLPLFILGDVFEIRDNVDCRVLNLFLDLVMPWVGDVVWVCGQHDSYLPGRSTLEGLRHKKNFHVVDRQVFHHKPTDTWHIPFCREEDDYRKLLSEIPDDAVVCTHLPLKEAIEQYGAKDVNNISVEEFARFRKVYAGDIHHHCTFKKEGSFDFTYIGEVSQRDWRDKGVVGHFGLLLGNDEMRRVETYCPQHVEIDENTKLDPNRRYVVKIKQGATFEKTDNIIAAVETTSIDLESITLTDTSNKPEDLMREYIAQNPGTVDATGAELLTLGTALLGSEN